MKDEESANNYFVELVEGSRRTRILLTAVELGVFAALAGAERPVSDLVHTLGCDERALRILLRALVALSLCEARGADRFANSALAEAYLVPSQPRYVGHNLAFQSLTWPLWSDLTNVVRTGRAKTDLLTLLSSTDAAFTRDYVRGMLPVARGSASPVAEQLANLAPRRILDVGAGPGAYTQALLHALPSATAVLLDLEGTLQVARDVLRDAPCADRLEFRAANYLTDEFGEGFDLVLMSHITHDESPASNAALFEKAHRALAPGGCVAVHDFLVDDESGCTPGFSALFAVHMLAYTRGGATYSAREYGQWLTAAGFSGLTVTPVNPQKRNATHLVVGRKTS
jgi:hypothetical protein